MLTFDEKIKKKWREPPVQKRVTEQKKRGYLFSFRALYFVLNKIDPGTISDPASHIPFS